MITFDNYKHKECGHIFKFWGKIYGHLKYMDTYGSETFALFEGILC